MITFDMTVDAIYYILLRRKKMNYINMGLICKLFSG